MCALKKHRGIVWCGGGYVICIRGWFLLLDRPRPTTKASRSRLKVIWFFHTISRQICKGAKFARLKWCICVVAGKECGWRLQQSCTPMAREQMKAAWRKGERQARFIKRWLPDWGLLKRVIIDWQAWIRVVITTFTFLQSSRQPLAFDPSVPFSQLLPSEREPLFTA